MTVGRRGGQLVQYWRSSEEPIRYAGDRVGRHRPAWAAFDRRARGVPAPSAFGIRHGTYEVARAESIYVDLPPMCSAAATGARPVACRPDRAEGRLAVATPERARTSTATVTRIS